MRGDGTHVGLFNPTHPPPPPPPVMRYICQGKGQQPRCQHLIPGGNLFESASRMRGPLVHTGRLSHRRRVASPGLAKVPFGFQRGERGKRFLEGRMKLRVCEA